MSSHSIIQEQAHGYGPAAQSQEAITTSTMTTKTTTTTTTTTTKGTVSFASLIAECQKAAGIHHDTLVRCLSNLKSFLSNNTTDPNATTGPNTTTGPNPIINENGDDDDGSYDDDCGYEYGYGYDCAIAILKLEIVRTGARSEHIIQDLMDECLLLCGKGHGNNGGGGDGRCDRNWRIPFVAAVDILKDAGSSGSGSGGDSGSSGGMDINGNSNRQRKSHVASVQTSLHTVRTLLLTTEKGNAKGYANGYTNGNGANGTNGETFVCIDDDKMAKYSPLQPQSQSQSKPQDAKSAHANAHTHVNMSHCQHLLHDYCTYMSMSMSMSTPSSAYAYAYAYASYSKHDYANSTIVAIQIQQYIHTLLHHLPPTIANACHATSLQLPLWATREKLYPRLIECAASMLVPVYQCHDHDDGHGHDDNDDEGNRGRDREVDLGLGLEEVYVRQLVYQIANHNVKYVTMGLRRVWKWNKEKGMESVRAFIKALTCTSSAIGTFSRTGTGVGTGTVTGMVASSRLTAAFLHSVVHDTIAHMGIYYPTHSRKVDHVHVCQEHCMPYLNITCLPFLTHTSVNVNANVNASGVVEEFVKMVLNKCPPSQSIRTRTCTHSMSGDKMEMKIMCQCLLLLLSQCDNHAFEDDSDSDSEDDDDDSDGDGDGDGDGDDEDHVQEENFESSAVGTRTHEANTSSIQQDNMVVLEQLAHVALVWTEPSFLHTTDHVIQSLHTLFLLEGIDFILRCKTKSPTNLKTSGSTCIMDLNELEQELAHACIAGIGHRLKVTDIYIREHGMRVGEKLSPLLGLGAGKCIRFEEMDGKRDGEGDTDGGVEQGKDVMKGGGDRGILKGNTMKEGKNTRARKMRRHQKKERVPKTIDPDEEYISDEDEGSDRESDDNSNTGNSTSSSQNSDMDSVYSADSEWDDDNPMAYKMEEEEKYKDQEQIDDDHLLVPRPHYLHECLALLRASGDDAETSCKHETAMKELPILVRAMPPDLMDVAPSLLKALVYLENKFGLSTFDTLRQECLCSLTACEPMGAVDYFQSQLFDEGISMGNRLELLEVMKFASCELSGHFERDVNHRSIVRDICGEREQSNMVIPKVAGKRRLVKDGESVGNTIQERIIDGKSITTAMDLSKTRRWGRGRNRLSLSLRNKTVRNRFGPMISTFFYPLIQEFAISRENSSIWGGESGGNLLSKLLITLSVFVDYAGFHPSTCIVAKDLFELSWSFFTAENPEVRKSVLLSLASCIPHLHQNYIGQVLLGNERIPDVLSKASNFDSNVDVRMLASALLGSFHELFALE